MTVGTAVSREAFFVPEGAADSYVCPVCGVGLAKDDFDTPVKQYYCPYCSTRKMPLPAESPAGLSRLGDATAV